MMASQEFARLFSQLSKAALIDALWCACQLGTNESADEIATQAARNVVPAMAHRGDRVPKDIVNIVGRPIYSDPS